VQFINIWEFMVVMPLGPDFARALHFDLSHVGWLASAYSLAGTVAGLIAARFLDRFDRRTALTLCLGGLSAATALAAAAVDFHTLLMVRLLAGLFGGPTIAVSLAVIADVFPPERRGEAMGKVMGSFALAAVIGVPLGLEIARLGGWWAPFLAIAACGALMLPVMRLLLPPFRLHLLEARQEPQPTLRELAGGGLALTGLAMTAISAFSAFLLIPHISAHVQYNLHYPREALGLLYFAGGIASFLMMRVSGRAADRFGFTLTLALATLAVIGIVFVSFTLALAAVPVLLMFIIFMGGMSVRNVTGHAVLTKIPRPEHRAGFMSVVSSLQNFSLAMGALLSAQMLRETPDGRLAGMETVSLLAIALFVLTPLLMRRVESGLKKRDGLKPRRRQNRNIRGYGP